MDKIDMSIYKDKRVIVTGSTGFKGSWLCAWLKNLGAEVYGLALPSPHIKSNFNLCKMGEKISQIYGDIRDKVFVDRVFDKIQPEMVFHLAAQPIVLESFRYPVETYDTNIMGTINVLEGCRLSRFIKSIVVVTSDKCYRVEPDNCNHKLSEDDPLGGSDPYSASKACSDIVSRSYYESFFLAKNTGLSTVRAGNVIGGGDWGASRLIPDCARSISDEVDIIVRNPRHVRPWQYVLEPVYGYMLVGASMCENHIEYSSSWNFGPSESGFLTVGEVVTKMLAACRNMGFGEKTSIKSLDIVDASQKETKILLIDPSKSEKYLCFKNILSADESIEWTAEDYFSGNITFESMTSRILKYEIRMLEGVKNEM